MKTRDVSLLSYAMDAVLDTGFSLLYRNEVLKFLLPLFRLPSSKDRSTHVHSVTRLLVSLGSPDLTIPFLKSFVPGDKLLAYQLAFDLVEGGAQDFLESIRKDLPEGDEVSISSLHVLSHPLICLFRLPSPSLTRSGPFCPVKSLSSSSSSS